MRTRTRTRTRTLRTASPKLTVPANACSDRQLRSSTKKGALADPDPVLKCEVPAFEPRETRARARAKRRKIEARIEAEAGKDKEKFNIFTRLLYEQIDVFFV
ncbi:hypothetical protein CVT26_001402, partial [Gymnopilus dilepis]